MRAEHILYLNNSRSMCLCVVYCYSHCGSLLLFYVFCTLLYVHSNFEIILVGKRELVALLRLFSWYLVRAVWLFLAVPWGLSVVCVSGIS